MLKHSQVDNNKALLQDNWQSYYALTLLLLAYILSFIDRNIMSVLIGPIRADFDISDLEFGLLHGLAFSIFYTFLGLPLGRLADRHSRTKIISIGVAFWSVTTCLCGVAKGFWGLFIARMGVGVGEAALSPPAHSLLSDYFSERKLPIALAVFSLGITFGGGLAYVLGSQVYHYFANAADLGWFSQFAPWQLTFIVVGAPGLLLALLMLTMKEPQRQGVMRDAGNQEQWLSWGEMLGFFAKRWRLYVPLFCAISSLSILGYGYMSWFIEFMMRKYAVTRLEIGSDFGTLFIVFGSIGALLGASLAAWLKRRGYQDANVRLIVVVSLLWMIPGAVGPQLDSASWAFWFAAPCLFFLNSYFGVSIAAVQLITPNQLRAQASAILLFMTNLLGLGLGPVIVGFFNDVIFTSSDDLAWPLSCLALVFCPLAAVLSYAALKPYRRALAAQVA